MSSPQDMEIIAEAARWLDRARHGSDDDRRAFRAWLRERPEHVAAMDLVERAWRQSPEAARAAGLRARQRPSARTTRPSWLWPTLGTALASIGGLLIWTGTVQEQQLTASGKGVAVATLMDGSRVWLTPGSRIALRSTLVGRSVSLNGEATFDVRHEWRSFAVTAGNVRVVDRGTLFSVAHREDRTSVVLAHGAVDIEDRQSGVTIATPEPGQQVTIDGNGAVISAIDADAALSWRDGSLIIENMPLSAAVARFGELGGPRIHLDDPAIGTLRVYGTYRTNDVVPFLDAMSALYPISWKRVGDVYEVRHR